MAFIMPRERVRARGQGEPVAALQAEYFAAVCYAPQLSILHPSRNLTKAHVAACACVLVTLQQRSSVYARRETCGTWR